MVIILVILAIGCFIGASYSSFMIGYYISRVQILNEVFAPTIEELRGMKTPHEAYEVITTRFYAMKPKGVFRRFRK